MSLRQLVYFQAAEAIAHGQNILIRLADLSLSEQEIGAEFSVDSAALAKIQIVATNDTVQAVSVFQQELASAYLELILKRARLIERKARIDLLTEFIDKSEAEQDRQINLMKRANLEGNADQRLWHVVSENIEFEKRQYARYAQEQGGLLEEQRKEHMGFVELCVLHLVGVSKLVPPAVFAVRAELELPIDREKYLASINENSDRCMKVFKSFLKDAE